MKWITRAEPKIDRIACPWLWYCTNSVKSKNIISF
ncbi:MAG: chromate resistance protein [Chitinophagaceae bacterium]|nr:chromate resistance protein [Chitinophagaceae bacterium]